MSTDLELCPNLPKIRISTIKVQTQFEVPKNVNTDQKIKVSPIQNGESVKEEDSEELECHTPKSEEHRIPKIVSCPPAPRKPRRVPNYCKRKLSTEFEFFDIVNSDQVESFFGSSFEHLAAKRRRFIMFRM